MVSTFILQMQTTARMRLFFLYMHQMVRLLSINPVVFSLRQQLIAVLLQSQVLISGRSIQMEHGQISVVRQLQHLLYLELIS